MANEIKKYGKGSKDRVKKLEDYRNNFSEIDWGKEYWPTLESRTSISELILDDEYICCYECGAPHKKENINKNMKFRGGEWVCKGGCNLN
jgi:hypothetical protein